MYSGKQLKESYVLMFRLPGRIFFIGLTIVLYLTLIYLVFLGGLQRNLGFYLVSVGIFWPLLVLLFGENKRIFNLKRTLFFVDLDILLTIYMLLIGSHQILSVIGIFGLGFSLSLMFMAFALGIDWQKKEAAFFVSLDALILLLGISLLIGAQNSFYWTIKFFLVYLIFSVMIYVSVSILSYSGAESNKISRMDMLKSYLLLHFVGRRDLIDDMFMRMSTIRKIPISITIFRSKKTRKPIFGIVVAPIHPGPLRNAGSADFPVSLYKKSLNGLGFPLFFFKGAGSHDMNLASLEEQTRLVNFILSKTREISQSEIFVDSIGKPMSDSYSYITLNRIDLGATELLLATNYPETTDDLETSLGYATYYMGKILDKDVMLIDMHNSLRSAEEEIKFTMDTTEYSEFLRLASKLIRDKSEKRIFGVGFDRSVCEGIGILEGLGELGIVSIVLKIEESLYVFVLYDSNNVTPELNGFLQKKIAEMFSAERVYVLSTDTHMVCGVSLESMYTVLGQKKFDEIVNCTINSVKKAMSNIQEAEVSGNTYESEVNVWGNTAYWFFTNSATLGVKAAVKTFIFSYVVALIINILLILAL